MQDFILDTDGDLKITGGDFEIGYSDDQHKRMLLFAEKGSFKEFPTLGVGAVSFLEGESEAELLNEINKQFVADGMKISKIEIKKTGDTKAIAIDAEY